MGYHKVLWPYLHTFYVHTFATDMHSGLYLPTVSHEEAE